jgi:hypothetical protein
MGFESFQVRLQNPQLNEAAISDLLDSFPQIMIDQDALIIGNSLYFVWNDGKHVIEIELDQNPAQLSARFMLCNPESVSMVYAELLLQLQRQVGGDLVICDPVPPNRPHEFTRENPEEFRDVLYQSIATRRAEWVKQFGPRVLAAKSRDAYREFIIPACTPVTGTLTSSH